MESRKLIIGDRVVVNRLALFSEWQGLTGAIVAFTDRWGLSPGKDLVRIKLDCNFYDSDLGQLDHLTVVPKALTRLSRLEKKWRM